MELGPTLSEFYSPTTTSERKKQLENSLHAFKALPNAHNSSLEIIVATVSRSTGEFFHVVCCLRLSDVLVKGVTPLQNAHWFPLKAWLYHFL